jgi:hypothetical protein
MKRPGKKERHYETSLAWQRRNPEKVAIMAKRARRKLKEIIFKHYGSKCACCGESQYEFLTIDHINGGGNKDRRKISKMRGSFFWIKQNNYPDDLQILCANCNTAKAYHGICPHQKQ